MRADDNHMHIIQYDRLFVHLFVRRVAFIEADTFTFG